MLKKEVISSYSYCKLDSKLSVINCPTIPADLSLVTDQDIGPSQCVYHMLVKHKYMSCYTLCIGANLIHRSPVIKVYSSVVA